MMKENLFAADDTYPTLLNKFNVLISDAESKLNPLKSVKPHPPEGNVFRITAFGKNIEFKFDFICIEKGQFRGKITSYLIENPDNSMRSETRILTFWMYTNGRILSSLDTESFQFIGMVSESFTLLSIVEDTLVELFEKDEFSHVE